MAKITAKVIGAQELARRWNNIGGDRFAEAALHAAALLVQNEAKKLVPKRTRSLSRSIIVDVVQVGPGKFVARIGPTEPHGKYVEFGTGIYAEGGNGRKTPWVYMVGPGKFVTTRGMKARPYLRPALDNKREAALREFQRIFMQKLREAQS